MIDFVHLKYEIRIPAENFISDKWAAPEDEHGNTYYCHTHRGVRLHYYPDKSELTIWGKIITLCHDTQVKNVDDTYGADLDTFIADTNRALNALFTCPLLDIRDFYVMRFDYCFNVKTPHVKDYIDFMTAAFRAVVRGKRINYTEENDLSGSVYVKTKSDYANNTRRNYVMNFYDKADWLENKLDEGWNFSIDDFEEAQDVLRLEAQCGGSIIRKLIKEHGIQRTFGDMLSFQLAYEAIENVYRLVLKADARQDYYSYAEAKKKVSSGAAAQALKKLAQNNKAKVTAYSADLIRNAGVYPFHFINKRSRIASLENPLKLIQKKLIGLDALSKD